MSAPEAYVKLNSSLKKTEILFIFYLTDFRPFELIRSVLLESNSLAIVNFFAFCNKGIIMKVSAYFRFLSSLFAPACLAVTVSVTGISGCTYLSQGLVIAPDRHAKAGQQDSFGDSALRVVYAEQNWNGADSLWFYNISQGSTLIPYEIFLHLEMPDSQELFRGDENMNHLRYLPQTASIANPDGLPVGWVKDNYAGKNYIGFNCAACHTSQIHYKGTAIRIDGGAAQSDMDLMLKLLAKSLEASLNQPEKFGRLARNVLKNKYPRDVQKFRAELAKVTQEIADYNRANESTYGDQHIPYGYARLDAFGRIYNRILSHLTPHDPTNRNPANAPVSYPYLWDTPQHDFVQWNGVGDNEGDGPLVRNTGEALGVFATFDLKQENGGFRSSVVVRDLKRMERHLDNLWSPRWEDLALKQVLPPINQALADKGREVYVQYQCHSCHALIDRTDPDRQVIAQFSSLPLIGTDPLMVINALQDTGKSGIFEGRPLNPDAPDSGTFQASTPALPALSVATKGVIAAPDSDKFFIRRWVESIYDQLSGVDNNPVTNTRRHLDFEIVNKEDPRTLAAYKARPLNGVWSSAPYLHNGSVPSLYELFLPGCSDAEIASGKNCRPNRFTVGTRELDPIKVGFVQRDPAEYPGLFIFDARLPGNSNKGHEYTSGVTPIMVLDQEGRPVRDPLGNPRMRRLPPITDDQRLALVEYLKTL